MWTVRSGSSFGYRLANSSLVLVAGAEFQMSQAAAQQADRNCRLKSDDGLLPDDLKGGLNGPVGKAIKLAISDNLDRGIRFQREGALNKDLSGCSFSCMLLGHNDEEEKHYLRHDEGTVCLEKASKVSDDFATFYPISYDKVQTIKNFSSGTGAKQDDPEETENPVAESE